MSQTVHFIHFTIPPFYKPNLFLNKLMFGFKKYDSLSGVLMELSLPSVDTIVFNSRVLFAHHYSLSCNKIAQWFTAINI